MELVLTLLLWLVVAGVVCAICYGIFTLIDATIEKNILRNIIAFPFIVICFIFGVASLILMVLIPLAILIKVIQFFWNY